ncbi:Rieske 2Fe-2S domain-containing protein [Pseudomonas sp. Irchel s3b5]|uniref:Rieske (2Fe-2S) protein n=1 Tax=Pseudomonas sp. Irchel s3b5 TaxID=2009077 RepID=UPI000BA304F8|nr:Rieske 2Fe-2S domain-containing protein [Pseudomonas sp. Irchel s3b5]
MMTKVCHISDIHLGCSLGFQLTGHGSDQFFIVNNGGTMVGYWNSCPHWPGSTLPFKKDEYLDTSAMFIICRGHGAAFDIKPGVCVSGPCVSESLKKIDLRIDSCGNILLRDLAEGAM